MVRFADHNRLNVSSHWDIAVKKIINLNIERTEEAGKWILPFSTENIEESNSEITCHTSSFQVS